jgi:ABC-type transport system substrate-binding protein
MAEDLDQLKKDLNSGRMSRREFIKFAAMLGLSMTAIDSLLASCAPAAEPSATPAVVASPTAVGATAQAPNATSLGRLLPPDAAPRDQQVMNLMAVERTHLDVNANLYDATMEAGGAFLWERLTMLDENNELIPGVAESWEQSDDGLTWTFHLREDAKWSDGSPLTAHDFEYGLIRGIDPTTGGVWSWYYYDIEGVADFAEGRSTDPGSVGIRAVDDWTLEIKTVEFIAYLPLLMAFPTGAPVPRGMVEQYGMEWTTNPETCLTNSAWKLSEWSKGRRIVLEMNPYYTGPYPAYLEEIIFTLGTQSNFFPAYQAGEIDAMHASGDWQMISPPDLRVIEADPELTDELHPSPELTTWYLFFRTTEAPFDSLKVRQAISHAIDRDTIMATTLRGVGQPAYTMLPPGMPGYQGDALRDIQNYDPALAQRLLEEAGYPGGQGFAPVDMWLREPSTEVLATAEAIQAMLSANLGIDVRIQPQEIGVYSDNLAKGEIPFSLISWAYDYIDPSDFLNLVWDSASGRHDWANAEFDRLVRAAKSERDPVERLALYRQAERILVEDVGGVFVWHPIVFQMWKPYVRGVRPDREGYLKILYYNTGMQMLYMAEH